MSDTWLWNLNTSVCSHPVVKYSLTKREKVSSFSVERGWFNHEWTWQQNRDSVWCFGGRWVLLEGTGSFWSFGVCQVPLPAPCTFVVRWLSPSDCFWQGVRTQSKWRAFSMIRCQLSLITPCLISLFCTLLISSSPCSYDSPPPPTPLPQNLFFPPPARSPRFALSFPSLSVRTCDWGHTGGVLMRPYQSLQTQIISATCVLQCFPWSVLKVLRAPQLVTEDLLLHFEEEMNAALVPF